MAQIAVWFGAVLMFLALLAIIKSMRVNAKFLGDVVKELKEANSRSKIDLNSLINPPSPPCHHNWHVIKEERLDGSFEVKTLCVLQCDSCGALDKTVESVKRELPRSECRHSWETQRTKELDSAYEQVSESGKKAEEMLKDPEPWMFRKCYIITRICGRCGELHTVTASNFDLPDAEQGEETTGA